MAGSSGKSRKAGGGQNLEAQTSMASSSPTSRDEKSTPQKDNRSIGERWYEIEDRRMSEAAEEALANKKAGKKWEGWR